MIILLINKIIEIMYNYHRFGNNESVTNVYEINELNK